MKGRRTPKKKTVKVESPNKVVSFDENGEFCPDPFLRLPDEATPFMAKQALKVGGYLAHLFVQPSDTPAGVHILSLKISYQKTKNPVYLIEAFLLAMQAKLYPPLWVLREMETAFQEYHDCAGKVALDKILGLNEGPGHRNRFWTFAKAERDFIILEDMRILRTVFKISVDNAVEMVERRMESPIDNSGVGIKAISFEAIKKLWREKGLSYSALFEESIKENPLFHDKEAQRKYLLLFPRDLIPSKFKTLLNKR